MKEPGNEVDAFAAGVARRKRVPRTKLGEWDAGLRRQDPLVLLQRSMRGRLAALTDLKYERMCASAFGFFRGAVPVMAGDLALMPNTGIVSQICGDAHVENLGCYGGLNGRLVFDVNDFDETIRAPFEWDLKRMTTSLLLAGREAEVRSSACMAAAEACVEAYCGSMRSFARMPVLDVARFQVHRLAKMSTISQVLSKAQRATPQMLRDRLTEETKHGRVFRSEPPVLERVTGMRARLVLGSLTTYLRSLQPERRHFFAQYRALDVAFKVVGTGSVGMRDYCVLMEGNGEGDPLFLQLKEEVASAYAGYVRGVGTDKRPHGQRAVEGQRAMQLQSDPLLGWTSFDGRDYLVRQLNDHKGSIDMTRLTEAGLLEYGVVCGELLARGHARSADARLIRGYVGNGRRFNQGILGFAEAYAEQTVEDWKQLVKQRKGAAKSG